MSLFSKLFKKHKNRSDESAELLLQREADLFADKLAAWQSISGPTIPFNPSQLRIVVFRESDRGRQLLFDSACLRMVARLNGRDKDHEAAGKSAPPSRKPSGHAGPVSREPSLDVSFSSAVSAGSPAVVPNPAVSSSLNDQRKAVAQTMRQSRSDVKMFGEMIFGSIPITVRSVITKVHELRNPFQLMMTKVYPVYLPVNNSSSKPTPDDDDVQGSRGSESRSSLSSDESMSIHISPPYSQLFVPDRLQRRSASAMASPAMTPSHSTSSLSSLTFSPPKALSVFGGSSSFKRRMTRNRSTSIDNGVKMLLDMDQEEEFSDGHVRTKKSVVAVACVIHVAEKEDAQRESFHEFFFTHTPLFEYSLNLFKAKLELALSDRTNFAELVAAAFGDFTRDVTSFVTATRLPLPMWLVIATEKLPDESCLPVLRLRLVDSLSELIARHDVKESQFFVSRLLTAILTGHLGWVSTVTPSNAQTSKYKMKHEPGWIQPLAKSHPYNPLWAQLGDLMGICGTPPRLTKTVLVSQDPNLLNAYLHVMSYFIRTSDVVYHRFEPATAPAAPTSSQKENVVPAGTDCLENGRVRRHQSGGGGENFRGSSTWFNKSKRVSGPRSRLASSDEAPVVTARPSRRQSVTTLEQDRQEQGAKDCVDGGYLMKSRHSTTENFPTMTSSKSFSTLSGVTSRSSITEETSVFWETSTDDNKLQTVCEVAAQVLSHQALIKDPDGFRRRRYTMLDRQDALESREFVRNIPRPPRNTTISINKTTTEKPVLLHVQVAPINRYQAVVMHRKFVDQAYENAASFATSLLAAPRAEYTPHFALQGCQRVDMEQLVQDLQVAAENSLTDEPCSEACAIVADLDKFTVKVVSRTARKCPRGVLIQPKVPANDRQLNRESDCHASNFVVLMLEAVAHLWSLRTTPEFCLMHLEDRLQEMYVQSQTMASFIRHQNTIDTKEMMDLLGLEMSDFPLIFAVASTHSADIVADLDMS